MRYSVVILIVLVCHLSACAPLATIPARQIETQKVTLGNVQRSVKPGASSAEVIAALGSPNIVSSNKDGTETWVYDKISAESEYAAGFASAVAVTSTRTLMVVIKYARSGLIETVDYRQTSY